MLKLTKQQIDENVLRLAGLELEEIIRSQIEKTDALYSAIDTINRWSATFSLITSISLSDKELSDLAEKFTEKQPVENVDVWLQEVKEWLKDFKKIAATVASPLSEARSLGEGGDTKQYTKLLRVVKSGLEELKKKLSEDSIKAAFLDYILARKHPHIIDTSFVDYLTNVLMQIDDVSSIFEEFPPKQKRYYLALDTIKLLRNKGEKLLEIPEEGVSYSIDDILAMSKGDIRRVFGGDAILYVKRIATTNTTLSDVERQQLRHNIIQVFVSWAKSRVPIVKQYTNLPDEIAKQIEKAVTNQEKVGEALVDAFAKNEGKDITHAIVVDEMVKFLSQLMRECNLSEEQIQRTLFAWSKLKETANIIAAYLQGLFLRAYIITYISTILDDFLMLGTEFDKNPKSCFWTTPQSHAIPSIVVATNVAVGFAFIVRDANALKSIGLAEDKVITVKKSWFDKLRNVGELVVRFLVHSSALSARPYGEYRLHIHDNGNIYGVKVWMEIVKTVVEDFLQTSILRRIEMLQKKEDFKMRGTRWNYKSPPA